MHLLPQVEVSATPQSTCAACESENAVWIEDPAGELRPLSATVKVRLLWLLRQ